MAMGRLSDWTQIGRLDEWARLDTPAHRMDARAKLLVTATFLVTVMSFPRHDIAALIPLFLFPLAMLSLGQIPLAPIARIIIIASPFAIVIGLFNPLLDRTPMIALGTWTISGGWLSFVSILLRFVLTVSAALALVAVTGMFRLGAGLERLGLPRIFITQLFFLYRYVFVIADEAGTMMRAVRMRAAGWRALPVPVYGALTGTLLLRSIDRAGRIHCAMVARGFDGHMRVGEATRFRTRDMLFIIGWCVYFFAARRWNLADMLGGLWS